ncbi:hypothetical protein [Methanoculleus taiwanensis]|uniref:hypothetical protein n=1 Tax=Methanoculleus taiwanensis TaxID=1550565 RepID=UPI000FFF242F|nr:hypothetical protein [Methanoculleus taiwanensis]
MNRRLLLLLAALVVTAAAALGAALLLSGTDPSAPTYTNTTYGYAVTYPDGWQYAETAGGVAFSSPDGHEEMRITADPLAGDFPIESVLRSLNTTYAADFARDIPGTEWVSMSETVLDGAPAYESVFSIPIQGEERYQFVARYAVHEGVVYSVMYTEFPAAYDPYTGHGKEMLESFRFI